MTYQMALTTKGQVLHAKIAQGLGTIPLEITRIVTASGYSDTPLELSDVIDLRQTAQIQDRKVFGVRAEITVLMTNQGNREAGIEPLAQGYELRQIGCYAIDPDEGEILYRISQFERPNWVPAATEMGWVFTPTWNFTTENASDVVVQIDPKGLVTRDYLDRRLQEISSTVEVSNKCIPDFGVRTHYRNIRSIPNYTPFTPTPKEETEDEPV